VIQKALEHYPVDWINDVLGMEDPEFMHLLSKTKCKIVINHSLGIPPSKERILPFVSHPIELISEWAEKKIALFHSYGISKDRLIIDPGIGFGKSVLQSISILKEINYLKNLGCEILVGHSRKSFLSYLTNRRAEERDIETIAVSSILSQAGVDYLRVHDVGAHQQFLSAATLFCGKG